MPELSIVIPCYNEEKNLPALLDRCFELLKNYSYAEVVIVDNGSKDNTQQVLASLLAGKDAAVQICKVENNQGYGFGILSGLKQAQGNVLCWTHADLQTDIFDCIKAYNIYREAKNENLLVKGKRRGRKVFDRFFTSMMSVYVLLKLKLYVSDVNAQPKLFSRSFYNKIVAGAPYDFSLDLYFLLQAKKKGIIKAFPVDFFNRVAGEAKGGGSGDLKLKLKLTRRTIDFINNNNLNA